MNCHVNFLPQEGTPWLKSLHSCSLNLIFSATQSGPFAWNDFSSPALDLNHAMHRIMDLTLCNPGTAYIADPASTFIPTLDSRDAMDWQDQRLQAMPLSIPSASQAIFNRLTPPRSYPEFSPLMKTVLQDLH